MLPAPGASRVWFDVLIGRGGLVRGALIGLLAACSSPAPATPAPPVIDAGADAVPVDAPPDDPAMAEILVWLVHQRDAMCACPDAACAEEVDALGFDWSFRHQDLLARARPAPAQDAAARAAIEETEACNERWHSSAP